MGGFDSHALPPTLVVTQVSLGLRCFVAPAVWLAGIVLAAQPAGAQRTDSARVAPRTAPPARKPVIDTSTRPVPTPPLSPRRAFAYSVILPGLGQSQLGRPTSGAIFMLTESIALAMLRESAAELREARRFRSDSLVFLGYDPVTGAAINQPSSFSDGLIQIRKGHVEDWIAFLIGNHLFAGADAYVAAHLWDLPSQIDVRPNPAGGASVTAHFRW